LSAIFTQSLNSFLSNNQALKDQL